MPKFLTFPYLYDESKPSAQKTKQTPVKNKINHRFPEFDQRLVEIKRTKTVHLQVLKEGHDT